MTHDSYIVQTKATELGSTADAMALEQLDGSQVPATVRNLVVHMDKLLGSVPPKRVFEPTLRRVSEMLVRLHELDSAELTEPRPLHHKLIGHCRTSSMLAVSLYRNLALAARPRCGFAKYYADGRDFFGDHWVVEVWHAPTGTWRLVDTELDESAISAHNITFDPADVPRDQFILAGQAWLDCRSAAARPETFGPYPDQTGWRQLANQLLRDAACLCGEEVGPFDSWQPEPLSESHLDVLDALAETCRARFVNRSDLEILRSRENWVAPPARLAAGPVQGPVLSRDPSS